MVPIEYFSGPVIGAGIGYCTNYIAVKMLFRPYYPKKIGSWQLPFTPGIIPRRQPDLARAIGNAVGNNLFTAGDLKALFLSDEVEDTVADALMEKLGLAGEEGISLQDLAGRIVSEEEYEAIVDKLSLALADRIVDAAVKMNLGELLAQRAKGIIDEKLSTMGMLVAMMSEGIVQSILEQIPNRVNDFISEEACDLILPSVHTQVEDILSQPLSHWTGQIEAEKLRRAVRSIYEELVGGLSGAFLAQFNIAKVVEEKVNAMDVKELEALVFSVMKKELNAIVNLGALIGLILGILNIFL